MSTARNFVLENRLLSCCAMGVTCVATAALLDRSGLLRPLGRAIIRVPHEVVRFVTRGVAQPLWYQIIQPSMAFTFYRLPHFIFYRIAAPLLRGVHGCISPAVRAVHQQVLCPVVKHILAPICRGIVLAIVRSCEITGQFLVTLVRGVGNVVLCGWRIVALLVKPIAYGFQSACEIICRFFVGIVLSGRRIVQWISPLVARITEPICCMIHSAVLRCCRFAQQIVTNLARRVRNSLLSAGRLFHNCMLSVHWILAGIATRMRSAMLETKRWMSAHVAVFKALGLFTVAALGSLFVLSNPQLRPGLVAFWKHLKFLVGSVPVSPSYFAEVSLGCVTSGNLLWVFRVLTVWQTFVQFGVLWPWSILSQRYPNFPRYDNGKALAPLSALPGWAILVEAGVAGASLMAGGLCHALSPWVTNPHVVGSWTVTYRALPRVIADTVALLDGWLLATLEIGVGSMLALPMAEIISRARSGRLWVFSIFQREYFATIKQLAITSVILSGLSNCFLGLRTYGFGLATVFWGNVVLAFSSMLCRTIRDRKRTPRPRSRAREGSSENMLISGDVRVYQACFTLHSLAVLMTREGLRRVRERPLGTVNGLAVVGFSLAAYSSFTLGCVFTSPVLYWVLRKRERGVIVTMGLTFYSWVDFGVPKLLHSLSQELNLLLWKPFWYLFFAPIRMWHLFVRFYFRPLKLGVQWLSRMVWRHPLTALASTFSVLGVLYQIQVGVIQVPVGLETLHRGFLGMFSVLLPMVLRAPLSVLSFVVHTIKSAVGLTIFVRPDHLPQYLEALKTGSFSPWFGWLVYLGHVGFAKFGAQNMAAAYQFEMRMQARCRDHLPDYSGQLFAHVEWVLAGAPEPVHGPTVQDWVVVHWRRRTQHVGQGYGACGLHHHLPWSKDLSSLVCSYISR